MSQKKLESFKAGSKQKPKVARPAKQEAAQADAAAQTLGFARIEGILEREEPGAVSKSLDDLYASIDQFEEHAKSAKDKNNAKKAKVAVERTIDLLNYLFQTKAELSQGQAAETPATPRK